MCPLCWATAAASCAALVVVTIIGVAGTDSVSLAIASLLGALSLLHRQEVLEAPWWSFAALFAAAAGRIGYLLLRKRDQLLIYDVWRRAKQIAAKHCPRKSTDSADCEV